MRLELIVNFLPKSISEFEALVEWCETLIDQKGAPGVVVGLSGTDSILCFLAFAEAFGRRGRPERVIGVHFGKDFPDSEVDAERLTRILELNPSYRWVSREIIPWLRSVAPKAQIIVDADSANFDDHARWAKLFSMSLAGAAKTEMLDGTHNYWVVGTRNATEEALGTYSNLSMAASVQPIVNLWKSDVLRICKSLNVPDVAVRQSRQVDCDCGRFDLAADHIEEVDVLLRKRLGQSFAGDHSIEISADLEARLNVFIDEQITASEFKRQIPYKPDRKPFMPASVGDSLRRAISEITNFEVNFGEAVPSLRTMTWIANMTSVDFIRRAGLMCGYSFSTWRFPSMSVDEKSLLEDFGFTRLSRPTDRYPDPTLSKPDRDMFGPGFMKTDGIRYFELRRAYLLVSWPVRDARVTLVVRNNSTYFGRDRLPGAVLISMKSFTVSELQDLTSDDFAKHFKPLEEFTSFGGDFYADNFDGNVKSVDIVECLADQFEHVRRNEVAFHQWLLTSGRKNFIDLLDGLKKTDRPLPYVGVVNVGDPQWFPEHVVDVREVALPSVFDDLAKRVSNGGQRIALLSGIDGDRP